MNREEARKRIVRIIIWVGMLISCTAIALYLWIAVPAEVWNRFTMTLAVIAYVLMSVFLTLLIADKVYKVSQWAHFKYPMLPMMVVIMLGVIFTVFGLSLF